MRTILEGTCATFRDGVDPRWGGADPDAYPCLFVWDVPGHPELQASSVPKEQGRWLSSIEIPFDTGLAGDLILAHVIDESPEGNLVTVRFSVEVP